MKKFSNTQILTLSVALIVSLYLGNRIYLNRQRLAALSHDLAAYREKTLIVSPYPTTNVTPTSVPTTTPSVNTSVRYKQPQDTQPWGVAKKIDDVTYSIKVGEDSQMASPQEILDALNSYRNVHDRSSLSWDDTLGSYAQSRAETFQSLGNTDKHAGFDSFLNNENGFEKLGYQRLGENSYYGGKLTGTHLIEWVFAQSPGHNANQLDSQWTHVGIGVTSNAVNLNFGG